MTVKYEPKHFEIYRPVTVEFKESGKSFEVVLDDEIKIPLDRRSDIVGQLNLGVDEAPLLKRFADGSYFMVDGVVADYRTSNELKFTHSHDSISEMIKHLGMQKIGNVVQMTSITSELECEALNGQVGGLFDVKVGFNWSPFRTDIESVVEMIRQICTNGMVASDPIMSYRVPVINMWQDNLQVGNDILVHQFNKLVIPRLEAMPNERISMYDVLGLRAVIADLRESSDLKSQHVMALGNMFDSLDELVTSDVVAIKKNLLQFIPAPISAYDAFNIATECGTHYVSGDKTSKRAQAFANSLLFNDDRSNKINLDLRNLVADTQTFMDVDRAFFGHTSH